MAAIEQVLNYVKQINERLNLWVANAKKAEELPVMNPMNPEGLLIASELEGGIWVSKQLEIQKIIDSISLAGQDNKVREVLLGSITDTQDLNYLLDNNGITVTENEIVILTALATVNATLVQRQYLWKLGKGTYNPIGSTNSNTKLIELQPRFLNEIIAEELTSSPSAIVYDFGIITDPILDVLNAADPARDYTDDEKIYYIRATKDGVNLLYNFIGTNGTYGLGESQMTEADLVLVYSSASVDITDLLINKTDRGGYIGTSQGLNNRIDFFENYGLIKQDFAWIGFNETGVLTDFELIDGGGNSGQSIRFTTPGSVTEIESLFFSTSSVYPYSGSSFYFKNEQLTAIKLPHEKLDISTTAGRYIWSFPDAVDLVVQPGQIVQLKLNSSGNRGKIELVGSSASGTSATIATDTITGTVKTDIEEVDPVVYTKTTMDTLLDGKVAVDGVKVLSDNNFDNTAKDKVSFITITQAVDLDDLEIRVNDLDAAVVLKGTWDASVGTFPAAGVAQAGWSYLVNIDGTVDGIEFKDGDRLICVLDNASTTTYAGNWYKADYTDRVNTVAGRTGNVVITSSDLSDFNSAVNALITSAISGKEDTSNKTGTIIGNEASTSLYVHIAGLIAYFQQKLTDVIFGAFINSLTAKTTPVDADSISIVDSADSNKQKKVSLTNFKAYLKIYFDTLYSSGGGSSDPSQITITTTVSITTDTLDASSKTQKGKNVVIDNGANAINITVNGGTDFLASYLKHGTGTITFVQGSGRTLAQVDGIAVLNGAVGSTATVSSVGTKDYLRISNV